MHRADKLVSGKDLEDLRKREEELWQTETRFDPKLMEQYFASDFFEFGRSGRTYTRDEMIFDPASTTEIKAKIPLENFSARYLSDEIVQVTYVSELDYDGEILRGNRSSIWSKTSIGWQLRFHQGTPVEVNEQK
ncbi:DUF4440 domain-containing protein [Maritalea sp.]|uniref:nuclear transport factor 2 family protein n=1 Tax=Maritalea sp. TaxID=2003361 RepID=UPI003EF19615